MIHRLLGILVMMMTVFAPASAQSETDSVSVAQPMTKVLLDGDTLMVSTDRALEIADSLADAIIETVNATPLPVVVDTTAKRIEIKAERFVPDSKKAMWMAIVFPGGGQIYNRKYWKLPLIYGGFLGCAYALSWNNTMYRDYSQAYIDIMDSDPNTKSYMNFVPASYNVEANMSRLQELFKRKKNFYRRYRDMSVFVMIGVYALSIVDAYVDAELSSFDISPDLSMKVRPTIIHDHYSAMRTPGLNTQSYGLQCSFSF